MLKRPYAPALLFAVSAGFACQQAAGPNDRPPPEVQPSLETHASGAFHPYGVPVPPGEVVYLPPEPYNSDRHSLPVPHTLTHLNEHFSAPGRTPVNNSLSSQPRRPPPSPGVGGSPKTDRWFEITEGRGSYAINDVQADFWIDPNLNPADSIYIYAPTQLGANGTCLEQTTAHFRNPYQSVTNDYHGFFNWCQATPNFIYWQNMNSAGWRSNYVRTYYPSMEERYTASVAWTYAAWNDTTPKYAGLLYNWNLGQWEEVTAHVTGTQSIFPKGWTMWEAWGLAEGMACPAFPHVRSSDIRYYYPKLTAVVGNLTDREVGYCWSQDIYTMQLHTADSDWEAETAGGGPS